VLTYIAIQRDEYLKLISKFVIRIAKRRTQLLDYLSERDYLEIAREARENDLRVVSEDIKIIIDNYLKSK